MNSIPALPFFCSYMCWENLAEIAGAHCLPLSSPSWAHWETSQTSLQLGWTLWITLANDMWAEVPCCVSRPRNLSSLLLLKMTINFACYSFTYGHFALPGIQSKVWKNKILLISSYFCWYYFSIKMSLYEYMF